MVRSQQELINRLAVALGLALDEIHNPGASRAVGVDIIALCEGVIKEAIQEEGFDNLQGAIKDSRA